MMPTLTVWSLRAALSWFVIGFTIGATMLIDKGVGGLGLGPGWLHAHLHVLLFGWLVQAVFAIAYWMLPRSGGKRPRSGLAAASIAIVNLSSAVAMAFPWTAVHEITTLLESSAIVLFAIHIWPRVKPFGTGK